MHSVLPERTAPSQMMASNAASGLSGRHHVSTRRCLAENRIMAPPPPRRTPRPRRRPPPRPAAAPRGRGCRSASRTSMAPFSLRFTSESSVRSSSPMGGCVLEHKTDAVVRAPEGDLRQPAQGVSRPGTPGCAGRPARGGRRDGPVRLPRTARAARPRRRRSTANRPAQNSGAFPPFVFNLQFLKKYSFTRSSAPVKNSREM